MRLTQRTVPDRSSKAEREPRQIRDEQDADREHTEHRQRGAYDLQHRFPESVRRQEEIEAHRRREIPELESATKMMPRCTGLP